MAIPFLQARVRLQCDISRPNGDVIDQLTNSNPSGWRGFPLNIELGFFVGEDEVMDMSNTQTVYAEFHDNDFRQRPSFAGHAADPISLNTTLTVEQWNGKILYHAMVAFSGPDMLLDLKGEKTRTFWLAIHRITTGGARQMLAGVEFNLIETGVSVDGPGPQQGGNLIPAGSYYDGSGNFAAPGIRANTVYDWTKNANDLSAVAGATTITSSGRITTDGASMTLTGTPGALVTALLRNPIYPTVEEMQAAIGTNVIRQMNQPGQSITLVDKETSQLMTLFVSGGDLKVIPVDLS